jgi:hypothetical protein
MGRFHEFINFMDSFRYDEDKGLSMYAQGREKEPIESFQKEEEDGEIKGDSELATA